jgi:hypothetical protein
MVACAPSAPSSVAVVPLEESKNNKNSKASGQMATISECRYRWLRVPATKYDVDLLPLFISRPSGGFFSF